jgi:hypothetical protein
MSGIAAMAASVIKTRKTEPTMVFILLLTCLPMTFLSAGRQQEIHAERDRKLDVERKQRQVPRQQAA